MIRSVRRLAWRNFEPACGENSTELTDCLTISTYCLPQGAACLQNGFRFGGHSYED
jgi:hypothetical protein